MPAAVPDASNHAPHAPVVRLDLASPRAAATAATALAGLPNERLPHGAYWHIGLAIQTGGPGGPPLALSLLPAGDLATYRRRLAQLSD